MQQNQQDILNEIPKLRLLLSFSEDRFSREHNLFNKSLTLIGLLAEASQPDQVFPLLNDYFKTVIAHDRMMVFRLRETVWENVYTSDPSLATLPLYCNDLSERLIRSHDISVLYDPFAINDFNSIPVKNRRFFSSVLLGAYECDNQTYLVLFASQQKLKMDLNARDVLIKYRSLLFFAIKKFKYLDCYTEEVRLIQKRYEKSIERIRKFVEISNYVFWRTDEDGFFETDLEELSEYRISPHLARINQELISHNITSLPSIEEHLADADVEVSSGSSSESLKDIVEKHQNIYKFITPVKCGSQEFFVGIQGEPFYGPDGEFQGYMGIFYDLSDEVRIKQNLIDAKKISEEISRSKTQFLAVMSHEIKTPMQAIVGILDLLSLTELNDEQRNLIQHVTHSANLLQTLLKDVLDYSRMGSNEMELEQLEFSVRFVLSSIVKQMQPKAENNGIKLKLEVDDNFPNIIVGDQNRLSQVIFNLIGNAIKFTQYGEVILKAYMLRNKTMRFEVSDTGIGISREKIGQLFNPFRQVDASMTRRFGGTGLGLAICRKIIELMNGKIGVDSVLGKGSTFWFNIPLKLPLSGKIINARSVVHTKEVAEGAVKSFNILLAEDSRVNQFIIKKMLENLGHKVVLADNGLKAIEEVERNEPDLVLMDLQMPEMDGIEASKRIIRYHPDLVILALTANASPAEKIECRQAGMVDIISKPVTIASLKSIFQAFSFIINESIKKKAAQQSKTPE